VPWIAQAGVGCFGALQITPHARRSSRVRVFRRAPNNPPRPPLKPRRSPEATFVSLTTPAGYPLCYASSEACRPVGVRVQIFCAGRRLLADLTGIERVSKQLIMPAAQAPTPAGGYVRFTHYTRRLPALLRL